MQNVPDIELLLEPEFSIVRDVIGAARAVVGEFGHEAILLAIEHGQILPIHRPKKQALSPRPNGLDQSIPGYTRASRPVLRGFACSLIYAPGDGSTRHILHHFRQRRVTQIIEIRRAAAAFAETE